MFSRETIRQQLDEIETLKAVFAIDGEFTVDESRLQGLQSYVDGVNECVRDPLTASLLVNHEDQSAVLALEVPLAYLSDSSSLPSCKVISSELPIGNIIETERVFTETAESCAGGEVLMTSLFAAMNTLKEFIDKDVASHKALLERLAAMEVEQQRLEEERRALLAAGEDSDDESGLTDLLTSERALAMHGGVTLGLRLCWSHHIIAAGKQQCIREWSRQLDLGGVCKIGWPGLILVEGREWAVREFVSALQRLRWQHFLVKAEETIPCKDWETVEQKRRFPRGGILMLGQDGMSEMAQMCKVRDLHDFFMMTFKR